MNTFTENKDYTIQGKVLGKQFTHEVYSKLEDDEDEIVYSNTYQYHEGNYSCDCNKRLFAGYDEQDDEYCYCGDSISYEELWLVRKDGTKVDLLKEGWFNNESS